MFNYQNKNNLFHPKLGYNDNENIYLANYKLLFFTIPKVGSTTIRKIFREITKKDHPEKKSLPRIKNHLVFEKNEGLIQAGFVRNPWSRLVSVYQQKREYNRNDFFLRNNLEPSLSFPEFVKEVCKIEDHEADKHFRSQYTFLTNPKGELVLNYLGRMETFSNDLSKLFSKIDLIYSSIPTTNSSKHKHYSEYYTSELAEMVEKRFKIDIELFNYHYNIDISEGSLSQWMKPISLENKSQILNYKSLALFKEYYKLSEEKKSTFNYSEFSLKKYIKLKSKFFLNGRI